MSSQNKHVCFVISPIGRDGSEIHNRFKDVLEFVIRPAIASAGYDMSLIRADDMNRPGSFIKDILRQLLDSYVVIADLTTQNPNVFYELGVRHALSPRTILIAQTADDIPSDLREYRTIVYDTSARGAANFKEQLQKYLKEIFADPHRADNPVMDRLGSVLERQTAAFQEEIKSLRQQLDRVMRKGGSQSAAPSEASSQEDVTIRVNRILKLHNAQRQFLDGEIEYGEGENERSVTLPTEQGPFNLYFLMDGDSIVGCWYVATPRKLVFDRLLADIRVLIGATSGGLETGCLFIIATNDNCSRDRAKVENAFVEMKKFAPAKQRKLLTFDLWDHDRLSHVETELGIRIISSREKAEKLVRSKRSKGSNPLLGYKP
jgi:hypothetical protein